MAPQAAGMQIPSEASREMPVRSDEVLSRWTPTVRGAYLEIPVLRLTRGQVQRLWDLDAHSCDRVLEGLIAMRFLEQATDGGFVRAPLRDQPRRQ